MPVTNFEDPWNVNSGGNKKNPNYNLNDFFNRIDDLFSGRKGSGKKWFNFKFFIVAAFVAVIIWFLSGFYIVNPEEEGVELIFGKYNKTSTSGLMYNFPYPIGSVTKVKVASINKEDIGYSLNYKGEGEGIMLTGDENIVNVNFEVQWRVKNAYDFLYRVNDNINGMSVKGAAESAMRDEIAQNKIGFILRGEGRAKIASETRESLQRILDGYNIGIEVLSIQMKKVDPPEKVISAFRDVQSARADKEREINQAYAYQNDILPRANGEATRIVKNAEAYKIEVINKARGDTERFIDIYKKYKNHPHVTMKRLYLETAEEVYKNSDKIVLDSKSALPFLDLMNKK